MSQSQVSPVSKEMKLFLYEVASDIQVFKEEIASLRTYARHSFASKRRTYLSTSTSK